MEFTADSSLTDATSAQKEHERRQTYVGPHFDELDWELQDAFQDYLEKRGVDGEVLGGFIADFADW